MQPIVTNRHAKAKAARDSEASAVCGGRNSGDPRTCVGLTHSLKSLFLFVWGQKKPVEKGQKCPKKKKPPAVRDRGRGKKTNPTFYPRRKKPQNGWH